jgi:outer membrane autotransporter protein
VHSAIQFLKDFVPPRRWPVLVGLILTGSSTLYGQTSWIGPSGSWFTASDWSNGLPNPEETATVDNGTIVQIASGTATANTLTIGGTAAGSTVQLLAGGVLILNNPLTIGNGGTLLFNGGTLEGAAGIIHDNGTVEFLGSINNGLGHNIDGSGQLIVDLTGSTLFVSSTNTYSGGTVILAGTLQADSTGALSPSSAFTVNSTLDLNGFDNTIGSLSGTGTVVNNGSSNATLTVGKDNTSTVFSGVLEDGTTSTLALTKVGAGALTLTGDNTYTGLTSVDGGGLIVDGSIASVQTVVNPGAFLAGNGVIRGDVVNNGIVVPGNPLGTLTISGNYTQNASGTLAIGVAGLAPGQFSRLAVNHHASLGGTLLLVPLNGFQFQVGDKLTFLTANGGVSGTFSAVQTPSVSNTIVKAQVLVGPNDVTIEGTQGSFANTPGVANTPNEQAVANALDSAAGDPRAAALFAFLNSQPLANLPHDLSLIAPTQISSMNATTVSLGKVQASNIGSRLLNVRGGSTGFSSSGFGITGGTASFDTGLAGPSGDEGKAGPPVFAPTPENRWGVFVTGTGEFTNVDSTPNAAGYNVNTGGITVGVDYRLTPNLVIGLDGSYAHTNVNLDGGGNVTVNAGTVGLYATAFADGFYLDVAASGGPNGYDTNRTALQGSASGSTEGANANVLVAGGYDWKRGNFSIGPTATFEFSYVSIDGFTETGSLAPLTFRDQSYESERTIFGAKAGYNWKIGSITLIPQVSVGWVHEYGSVAYSVIANFANGAGNSFTVNGPEIGRDGVLVTAGMSMLWTDRISTYIYYDGELARTNYDSHTVVGGVRISF